MQSKVVIVTGASRGIGANIVKTLAKKGYNVILNYNTSEKEAITVKQELEKKGIEIEIFKADVSKKEITVDATKAIETVNSEVNKYLEETNSDIYGD